MQIKKNDGGVITIPNFKLYYRTIVTLMARYWHKTMHVNHWNRIENPKINPHRYTYLIFKKGTKKPMLEERQPLEQMMFRKLDTHM
jgi:hypothetical protein